jgi:hypothetical protein
VRNSGQQKLSSNDYLHLTEWENWINQAMHHCYILAKIISQIWTIKGAIEDISILIRETLNVSLSMEKVSQIIGFLFLRDISKQLRPPEQINMRGILRALFCDFSKPKVLERYIFSIRNQNLKTDDHRKESVKEGKIDEAPWEGCYHIDTEKFPCPDNFSQLFAENLNMFHSKKGCDLSPDRIMGPIGSLPTKMIQQKDEIDFLVDNLLRKKLNLQD